MRSVRRSVAGLIVAAVVVVMVAPTAAQAYPQPGGRILYLEFVGSTGGDGALKSVQPNGLGGQDFGRQLPWFSGPDYSPDGTQIAYADVEFSIRAMAADGTNDRLLTQPASGPAFPRWSPDGLLVAFESGADIWAVHRDGAAAGLVNLTGAHDSTDLVPAWAPNGRLLAAATLSDIRIYSADGVQLRTVIPVPGAYRLDWSPKRGLIAVEALGDLWLVTVPSGAVERLTNTPSIQETSPIWSPDGGWLAFGNGPGVHDPNQPGLTTDPVIWLMDRKGGHQRSTGVPGVPNSWRSAP
jgi:TolB protein